MLPSVLAEGSPVQSCCSTTWEVNCSWYLHKFAWELCKINMAHGATPLSSEDSICSRAPRAPRVLLHFSGCYSSDLEFECPYCSVGVPFAEAWHDYLCCFAYVEREFRGWLGSIHAFPIWIYLGLSYITLTCHKWWQDTRINKYVYGHIMTHILYNRRKLRSQTSDNMDRWKAEMGGVREEKKKEDQKRESLRRKKIQVREKVGKSRNTVFSNDLWLRRVEK